MNKLTTCRHVYRRENHRLRCPTHWMLSCFFKSCYLSHTKRTEMKILKTLLILLLVLVAVGLIAALILPKEMNVNTEKTIDAPIDMVWDNISSFEKADRWSAWYDIDPDMKVEFEGEPGAVGSKMKWSGNDQVQTGTMTITNSDKTNYALEQKVEHSWGGGNATMKLEPTDDGKVKVIYTYNEKYSIPSNLMAAMFDSEGMMTKNFNRQLDLLDSVIQEDKAKIPAAPVYSVEQVEREAITYMGMKKEMPMADITSAYYGQMYGSMMGAATGAFDTTHAPVALYWTWDEENQTSLMTAGLATTAESAPEGFELYELPAGSYMSVDYYGAYDGMKGAHEAIWAHMQANNMEMGEPIIEEYITDPQTEPDSSKWLTRVMYPIKQSAEE